MNKKILLTSLLLLLIRVSLAIVPANVDRTELPFGQSLTLTITLPNSNRPNLDILNQDFEVYGTSTSSQTSIINGHISSQHTLSVNLMPKRQGALIIPAIKVGNDATLPIQIKVAKPAKVDENVRTSKVFVEASIKDQNAYVGTPIQFNVRIYYTVPLNNLTMAPLEIGNAQIQTQGKSIQYQANENGTNYEVIEQKFLITPRQAGDIKIPPVKIQGSMADNTNNDIFDMGLPKPFIVLSKPVTMHIKPIPNNIGANSWLPAKNITLSEQWSHTSDLKVGQPVTRTISIEAVGIPATSIPNLNFPSPSDVSAYPDKAQADTTTQNDDLVSHKTFKIAYIPNKAGTIQFPEIRINWWDIVSDSPKTAVIPAKNYTVAGDNTSISSINSSTSLAKAQNNHVKSIKNIKIIAGRLNNLWFYSTIAFALLCTAMLLIVVKLYRNQRRTKLSMRDSQDFQPKDKSKPINIEICNSDIESQNIRQHGSDLLVKNKNNLKKAVADIHKACQNQDIKVLNQALINWASLNWQQKIYTISDLKNLANNPTLSELIDKLNLALYRNQEFAEFTKLASEIDFITNTKPDGDKSVLKELYPE